MALSEMARFSDYTIMRAWPDDNGFMAINTLTNAVAMLGRDVRDAIDRGVRMDDPRYLKELEELRKLNIIVPSQKNENCALRYYMMNARSQKSSFYGFQIFPTLGCNLTCPYCYAWRAGQETKEVMSAELAAKAIDFIKDQMAARELQSTRLSFCGGEPLLHSALVLEFCRDIFGECAKMGVETEANLVTNGVFLTKDIAGELLGYCAPKGKLSAQITLDGPKQMHDVRRKARDGSSSFETIMRNLRELDTLDPDLTQRLDLSVRINVDRQNIDTLVELAEQVKPLVDCGIVRAVYSVAVTSGCLPHDRFVMSRDEWLAVMPPVWHKIADMHGLEVAHQTKMSACGQFNEGGILIGPDGYLYTCMAWAGEHAFSVGHLDTGMDVDAYQEQVALNPWEECMGKCPVVPWCWGGCRNRARNNLGDWRALLCEKQDLMDDGFAYYRFKHREQISKWLYNRRNGIPQGEYDDYKEVAVSRR